VTGKLNALRYMVASNGDIAENVNFAIKASVAATFLESNGVVFATSSPGPTLASADLADKAKALSARVNCR